MLSSGSQPWNIMEIFTSEQLFCITDVYILFRRYFMGRKTSNFTAYSLVSAIVCVGLTYEHYIASMNTVGVFQSHSVINHRLIIPNFVRGISLALWQSYDCPSFSEIAIHGWYDLMIYMNWPWLKKMKFLKTDYDIATSQSTARLCEYFWDLLQIAKPTHDCSSLFVVVSPHELPPVRTDSNA